MCGGKCSRFGEDKSLLKYNGKEMILRVLITLKKVGIKKVVLIANQKNYKQIKKIVSGIFEDFYLIKNPPDSFRKGIECAKDFLDRNFLLTVGNQPSDTECLKKMISKFEKSGNWTVSLYNKIKSVEKQCASECNGLLLPGNDYVLQHPLIISKDIINYQKAENFSYKLETTIYNQLKKRNINSIIVKMPPEFDNKCMLENNLKFIDSIEDMNLLLLPGNSISNKEWIYKVFNFIKKEYDKGIVHKYNHWENGEGIINLNTEIESISNYFNEGHFIIFAKSVGCLVALKAMYEKKIFPVRCYFLGFPFNWAKKNGFDFDKWMSSLNIPVVFIQNNNDPFMKCDELKNYLKSLKISNYKIYESRGDTHDYDNLKEIKKIMEENNG